MKDIEVTKSQELSIRRAVVKNLLLQVLSDPNQAQSILEKWPSYEIETDKKISGAWGVLVHFCNDVDLRKKDQEYSLLLLQQLKISISEL